MERSLIRWQQGGSVTCNCSLRRGTWEAFSRTATTAPRVVQRMRGARGRTAIAVLWTRRFGPRGYRSELWTARPVQPAVRRTHFSVLANRPRLVTAAYAVVVGNTERTSVSERRRSCSCRLRDAKRRPSRRASASLAGTLYAFVAQRKAKPT